eukprot:13207041-Alexandrium_andersonii.AAC.1
MPPGSSSMSRCWRRRLAHIGRGVPRRQGRSPPACWRATSGTYCGMGRARSAGSSATPPECC